MAEAKIYVDEDITDELARALRAMGFDAVSAHEVEMRERSDAHQLQYAVSQGRVFLTCNFHDFEPLAKRWAKEGQQHFGIIVSQQLEFGEMLRRTRYLLQHFTAEQLINVFMWLFPVPEEAR